MARCAGKSITRANGWERFALFLTASLVFHSTAVALAPAITDFVRNPPEINIAYIDLVQEKKTPPGRAKSERIPAPERTARRVFRAARKTPVDTPQDRPARENISASGITKPDLSASADMSAYVMENIRAPGAGDIKSYGDGLPVGAGDDGMGIQPIPVFSSETGVEPEFSPAAIKIPGMEKVPAGSGGGGGAGKIYTARIDRKSDAGAADFAAEASGASDAVIPAGGGTGHLTRPAFAAMSSSPPFADFTSGVRKGAGEADAGMKAIAAGISGAPVFRHAGLEAVPETGIEIESPLNCTALNLGPVDIAVHVIRSEGDTLKLTASWRPYPGKGDAGKERDDEFKITGSGYSEMLTVPCGARGIYTIGVENTSGDDEQADVRVLLFPRDPAKERARDFGTITLGGGAKMDRLIRVLLPEGVFWDDDGWFSGVIESTRDTIKYKQPEGIEWREKR